jgi:hypothetical protein
MVAQTAGALDEGCSRPGVAVYLPWLGSSAATRSLRASQWGPSRAVARRPPGAPVDAPRRRGADRRGRRLAHLVLSQQVGRGDPPRAPRPVRAGCSLPVLSVAYTPRGARGQRREQGPGGCRRASSAGDGCYRPDRRVLYRRRSADRALGTISGRPRAGLGLAKSAGHRGILRPSGESPCVPRTGCRAHMPLIQLSRMCA